MDNYAPTQGGFSAPVSDGGFEATEMPIQGQVIESESYESQQPQIQGAELTGPIQAQRIMEIPGTAHDKLVGLVDIPDQEVKEKATYKDMVHISSEEDEALVMQGLSNAREIILANPNLKPEEIFEIQEQEVKKVRIEAFEAKSGSAERFKSKDGGARWTSADTKDDEEGVSWSEKGLFEVSNSGEDDAIKTGLINAKAIIMANPGLTPKDVLRIQDEEIEKAKNDLAEKKNGEQNAEDFADAEPSIEQKIILSQAKAMEFMSKSMEGGSEFKGQELEELLKELRKLLEEIKKDKPRESESWILVILGIIMMLLNVQEKAVNSFVKEVESV